MLQHIRTVSRFLVAYLLARAREPSTWAGMGPLLTAIGWQVSPEAWEAISFVCMGACGLLAILIKDKAT